MYIKKPMLFEVYVLQFLRLCLDATESAFRCYLVCVCYFELFCLDGTEVCTWMFIG